MTEKRKLKRRNFIFDIEVIDQDPDNDPQDPDRVLGELADITAEGVMIVSDEPVTENKAFSLRIDLPEPVAGCRHIEFKALSIRCDRTIHDTIFTTGFQITDIDDTNRSLIEVLIDEYAV